MPSEKNLSGGCFMKHFSNLGNFRSALRREGWLVMKGRCLPGNRPHAGPGKSNRIIAQKMGRRIELSHAEEMRGDADARERALSMSYLGIIPLVADARDRSGVNVMFRFCTRGADNMISNTTPLRWGSVCVAISCNYFPFSVSRVLVPYHCPRILLSPLV